MGQSWGGAWRGRGWRGALLRLGRRLRLRRQVPEEGRGRRTGAAGEGLQKRLRV